VLDAMDRSEDGRVHRGFMGISFESRPGTAAGLPCAGAIVKRVAEGEAAHRAGLRPGDIVLTFGGHAVSDASDLYDRITRTAPGSEVVVTLERGGHALEPIAVVLRDSALPKERERDLVH
jgi:serine protease Do